MSREPRSLSKGNHPNAAGQRLIASLFAPALAAFPPLPPQNITILDPENRLQRNVQWDPGYESDLSHYHIEFGFTPAGLRLLPGQRGQPLYLQPVPLPPPDLFPHPGRGPWRQRQRFYRPERLHSDFSADQNQKIAPGPAQPGASGAKETMAAIKRDVAGAASSAFDLVIVGGGIYGTMLALEAGRRGKRALLLEKDDFGGATSLNHLRTVHGGLRYLQSLDLPRFFESVPERRWFLANFPALVRVLPCLMPLYGRGLKRASIMRAGLLLNDCLGLARNAGVAKAQCLPQGKVVGKRFLRNAFPQVDRKGLQGAALWYDAAMPEHQRLLMEILRWACDLGATALNYVQAESLLLQHGKVGGVLARDCQSGQRLEFRAPVVINAAGPWCRQVAQNFDCDYPQLLRNRLLLFNILFKRKALSAIRPGPGSPRPPRPHLLRPQLERPPAGRNGRDPGQRPMTKIPRRGRKTSRLSSPT